MKTSLLKNPLIVAMDLEDEKTLVDLAHDLADVVGSFKLGPRALNLFGPSVFKKIANLAPLFFDAKYFDIPSVTVANVRSAFELGASLVTVHAMVGPQALIQLAELEKNLNQIRPFKILCVTLLTSFDATNLPTNLMKMDITQQVVALAADVKAAGLHGIVCSPNELEALKSEDLFLVTPGIRFSLQSNDDQKRVTTPQEAIRNGASAIVVGRPIISAPSPRQAALDFSLAIFTKK